MNKVNGYNVMKMCQRKQWFTNGTRESYEKVLKCADDKLDIKIIAYMIWICSNNVSVEEIEICLKILELGEAV